MVVPAALCGSAASGLSASSASHSPRRGSVRRSCIMPASSVSCSARYSDARGGQHRPLVPFQRAVRRPPTGPSPGHAGKAAGTFARRVAPCLSSIIDRVIRMMPGTCLTATAAGCQGANGAVRPFTPRLERHRGRLAIWQSDGYTLDIPVWTVARARWLDGPRNIAGRSPSHPPSFNMPKYIVRTGVMRALGVFSSSRDETLRPQRQEVVARTDRGLEIGDVLCEATRRGVRTDQGPGSAARSCGP